VDGNRAALLGRGPAAPHSEAAHTTCAISSGGIWDLPLSSGRRDALGCARHRGTGQAPEKKRGIGLRAPARVGPCAGLRRLARAPCSNPSVDASYSAFTPDGQRLRATSYTYNVVYDLAPQGNVQVVYNGSSGIQGPAGATAFDSQGAFYMIDSATRILKF